MAYQFHGQRPDEEVVLFTRQHPFVALRSALWVVVFCAFPILVWVILETGLFVSLSLLASLIVAVLIALMAWYRWFNTVFMLTNERVLFLEQRGLFTREMAECPLTGIQQVSHKIHGVMPTIFGYGVLSVATSAGTQSLDIYGLPEPYEIQEDITAAMQGEGIKYER